MVLDPLTALGLASNIIQLIDFGGEVLAKSRELHKASSGYLVEHQELYVVTQRLENLRRGIDDSLNSISSKIELTPAEVALREVTQECQKIAQEFQEGFERFAAQPDQSSWKSFRQAFKAVWNKDGVELMQRRLSKQREQLVVHLLLVVSERQKTDFNKLLAKTSGSEATILKAIEISQQDLKSDLKALAKLNQKTAHGDQNPKFAQNVSQWTAVHQNDVERLSKDVSQLLTSDEICECIISSLYFQQIRDRKLQIEARSAYPETFTWIFDRQSQNGADDPSNANFEKWLEGVQDSDHLFWVAGKPGSGKSTLMHFLSEAPETNTALELWRDKKPLLSASSFFWLSGSSIQKSLKGLLRSLLHDLLRQQSSLATEIAHWRWHAYTYGARVLPEWTNSELIEGFRKLVQFTAPSHRIFLLIDGLDEFEGTLVEQTELVDFLKSVGNCSNVKICVSSRPWPIFRSAFESYPHFRLEDLTRDDISLYVNGKFSQVSEFDDLKALYPTQCSTLVHDVVEKAQGVFLWVYLVVLSLSRGMMDGDSMHQLQERLYEIPGDLEKFFRQIIMAIPEQYRPLASCYFNVMIATPFLSVSVLSFSFLEESNSDFLRHTPVQPVSLSLIEARKRSMARRLESRCKGLLQVNNTSMPGPFVNQSVDFLHRTVRDFLLSKDIQQILEKFAVQSIQPFLFLCQSILAQLKMIDPADADVLVLADNYLIYARELELTTGAAYLSLSENFFAILHGHLLRSPEDREKYGSVGSILKMAIQWGLEEFSKAKIAGSEFSVNERQLCLPDRIFYYVRDEISQSRRELQSSLLLDECTPRLTPEAVQMFHQPGVEFDEADLHPLESIVAALFAKGANPNLRTVKVTVWERFLAEVHHKVYHLEGSRIPVPAGPWLRCAKLFVQYGASAVGQDPRHPPDWRERAAAGKKYRVNYAPQDLAAAVEDLFAPPGGKELAEALRARGSVKGRLKKLFSSSNKELLG